MIVRLTRITLSVLTLFCSLGSQASDAFLGMLATDELKIAVGCKDCDSGPGRPLIVVSQDGFRWRKVEQKFSTRTALFQVIRGRSGYLIAGGSSYLQDGGITYKRNHLVLTSKDGMNWTEQSVPGLKDSYFDDVAYFKGRYVAVDHEAFLWTSPDGADWKKHEQLDLGWEPRFSVGDDHLVLTGEGSAIWISRDGTEWRRSAIPGDPRDWSFNNMIFHDGRFFGSAAFGFPNPSHLYRVEFDPHEPDFSSISQFPGRAPHLGDIAFFNGRFLGGRADWIKDADQFPGGLWRSSDFTNWDRVNLPGLFDNAQDLGIATSTEDVYIFGDERILRSNDGIHWIEVLRTDVL